jgi:two-component system sensor histidine kinase CpxA
VRAPALRVPLYLEFLGWAVLNLLLIAVLLYLYAPRDETGLNLFLSQSVRERLTAIAREIGDELYGVNSSDWGPILARHRNVQGVELSARATAGPPPFGPGSGGRPSLPPPEVRPRGGELPGDPSRSDWGPPERGDLDRGRGDGEGVSSDAVAPTRPGGPSRPGDPDRSGGPSGRGPAATINIQRLPSGSGYAVTILIEVIGHGTGPPRGYLITAFAANSLALLRLLGINRELRFGVILLLVSALLWWPFIWRITRAIRQLSEATRRVAQGRLDTRVDDSRRDELGDLATAVNSMAERLELLVSGQRQFVADVAHEVISPVARMQIGLGILEGRVDESSAGRLKDVLEDLDSMAAMLNELLLFSRSGIEAERCVSAAIDLRPAVEKVVATESGGATVIIDVAPEVRVNVRAASLSRALANIVRNAVRYGGDGPEPVEIVANVAGDRVRIAIRDRGPGVPESALARLGEPFFRPELARSRATGGFGLGLAIVRRCVLACDGEVSFNNRPGGGFEAQISVPAASQDGFLV